MIDTGGFVHGSDDVYEEAIRAQVVTAIEEADLILFIVDVVTGQTDLDDAIAGMLRKSGKKVFLVANKVDSHNRIHESAVFYSYGLGEVFNVSAISGSGTGELLDALVQDVVEVGEDDSEIPRIAIIGQPNVGKSSLLNALTGQERSIVTDRAGTTRDTISTRYTAFGFDFILVDTAGIRKKSKVTENLEFYSVLRAIRAIESSDVCLLMIDAAEGFTGQDQKILHLVERNHKGLVIMVNKWDLVEKDHKSTKKFTERIMEKTAPFTDIPMIFTSVINKQRVIKALEMAIEVYNNRNRRIPTSKLNDIMLPVVEKYPPPAYKGKHIKIKYVTQLPSHFPQFVFFCSNPKYVREPYRRYLENNLRENFQLSGVPISVYLRDKEKKKKGS